MKPKYIQHLYWRAGFGILPTALDKLSKKSKKEVVENLFKASNKVTPLTVDTSELEALMPDSLENMKENVKSL